VMGRFRREVKLTRKIGHPNVCRLFDIGEHRYNDSTVTFLSMEYLEGETLAHRLDRDQRMKPDEALPLIRQMAEALEATHASGVIHRDFKPSNVMLAANGSGTGTRVIVTDFGLACTAPAGEELTALTESRQILGTPDYMAPEMALDGRTLDGRSDMYALGASAYRLLTGERLFTADAIMQLLLKHLNEPPPLVTDKAHVPEPMASLVMRCLAKSPEERPSAVEMWRELEASRIQDGWTTAMAREWWAEHVPESGQG